MRSKNSKIASTPLLECAHAIKESSKTYCFLIDLLLQKLGAVVPEKNLEEIALCIFVFLLLDNFTSRNGTILFLIDMSTENKKFTCLSNFFSPRFFFFTFLKVNSKYPATAHHNSMCPLHQCSFNQFYSCAFSCCSTVAALIGTLK
ncbi:hypothetical protein GOODEAATRI_020510 [Goodea atripinnis]|uniref:Uncharacterized protein n=1 Tax=Goodea atripinnis TaxID=208336 RepID=A0ABV0MJE7_9TELE